MFLKLVRARRSIAALCAAAILAGCAGQGSQSAQGILPSSTAPSHQAHGLVMSGSTLIVSATYGASYNTQASLGISQWQIYTWTNNTVSLVGIGGGRAVWEVDVQNNAAYRWTEYVTTTGSNLVSSNGTVTGVIAPHADTRYLQAAKNDISNPPTYTFTPPNGPIGPPGGGGPKPAAGVHLMELTVAKLLTWVGAALAVVSVAGCAVAEPCGVGLIALGVEGAIIGAGGATADLLSDDPKSENPAPGGGGSGPPIDQPIVFGPAIVWSTFTCWPYLDGSGEYCELVEHVL